LAARDVAAAEGCMTSLLSEAQMAIISLI